MTATTPTAAAGALAAKRAEMTLILDRFRSAADLAAIALESEPEESAQHLLLALDKHARALRRIAKSNPSEGRAS